MGVLKSTVRSAEKKIVTRKINAFNFRILDA